MKRTTALLLVATIGLAGCQSNNGGNIEPSPAPVPSVVESQTTKPAEPSKSPAVSKTPDAPDPDPSTAAPAPVTTTTGAITPAVEFAQRWGLRYPSVPEYVILKAANGTCTLIESGGVAWISKPVVVGGIEDIVTDFGIEKSQALEFAQDAEQNYCASVANPT